MKEKGLGRRTFNKWLETVRSIEHEFCVRMESLKLSNYTEFKTKNGRDIKKDNLFANLVAKHKHGDLTTDQYFDAVVKANTCNGAIDLDLPAGLQI